MRPESQRGVMPVGRHILISLNNADPSLKATVRGFVAEWEDEGEALPYYNLVPDLVRHCSAHLVAGLVLPVM